MSKIGVLSVDDSALMRGNRELVLLIAIAIWRWWRLRRTRWSRGSHQKFNPDVLTTDVEDAAYGRPRFSGKTDAPATDAGGDGLFADREGSSDATGAGLGPSILSQTATAFVVCWRIAGLNCRKSAAHCRRAVHRRAHNRWRPRQLAKAGPLLSSEKRCYRRFNGTEAIRHVLQPLPLSVRQWYYAAYATLYRSFAETP